MADKFAKAFDKPTLLVPPVIELRDFDPTPLADGERQRMLAKFQIEPDTLVVFLAGTIYDFSEEFETFLRSLALASLETKLTLAIAGRSRVKIAPLVERHLKNKVAFRNLGTPDDARRRRDRRTGLPGPVQPSAPVVPVSEGDGLRQADLHLSLRLR